MKDDIINKLCLFFFPFTEKIPLLDQHVCPTTLCEPELTKSNEGF